MARGPRESKLEDIIGVESRDRHDDLAKELRSRKGDKSSTPRMAKAVVNCGYQLGGLAFLVGASLAAM